MPGKLAHYFLLDCIIYQYGVLMEKHCNNRVNSTDLNDSLKTCNPDKRRLRKKHLMFTSRPSIPGRPLMPGSPYSDRAQTKQHIKQHFMDSFCFQNWITETIETYTRPLWTQSSIRPRLAWFPLDESRGRDCAE